VYRRCNAFPHFLTVTGLTPYQTGGTFAVKSWEQSTSVRFRLEVFCPDTPYPTRQ